MSRRAVFDAWLAVALNYDLTHSATANACIVMSSLHWASPKEHQRSVARVDRAMCPERRDVSNLARSQLRRAGRSVFLFEQHEPLARQSLVSFRMIAFAVVMAAGQVIFGSHLARINDRRAKKDITFVLTFIKGIVFVAKRIIFFANATFQIL